MIAKPTSGIVVDGSCENNPGIGEWQGRDLETGNIIFKSKRYEDCTNNQAEFLACVHALAYCEQHNLDTVIYSDSQTARSWVTKGMCNSQHASSNPELNDAINRANKFLQTHPKRHIETWFSREWGISPADFGKKGWY